ncbi:MAG: glycosyltransferase family 2 protein [Pseudomonadota bacterium]
MEDAAPARPSAPITAYIRTKNEGRMTGDVVRAAFAVASEVIVVDSGSTDETVQQARAAGARVIESEWRGYGSQKRIAEDAAQNDWLLDLDADEVVTPALAEEINALFANGAPDVGVFRTPMAIAPPIGAPWRNFALQSRAKLYDRRVIRMPDHAFWDQFKIPAGVPVGAIKEPIRHYAFADAHHLMEKLNKYSTDRALTAKSRPLPVIILRIFFGLPIYFFRRYFLEGCIRGGAYGFAYALMTSFRRWLVDVKLYEREMSARHESRESDPAP